MTDEERREWIRRLADEKMGEGRRQYIEELLKEDRKEKDG